MIYCFFEIIIFQTDTFEANELTWPCQSGRRQPSGRDIMTTINCSLNCRHQHDGKCMLENAISDIMSTDTDCIFFEEKADRNRPALNPGPLYE